MEFSCYFIDSSDNTIIDNSSCRSKYVCCLYILHSSQFTVYKFLPCPFFNTMLLFKQTVRFSVLKRIKIKDIAGNCIERKSVQIIMQYGALI